MAKVKGGLHSDSVGGATKSMIFRKGKKSTTVTGYYKPGSAKRFDSSDLQLFNQFKYAEFTQAWRALTPEQQAVFNENAKGTTSSGWNLYYKTAMENFVLNSSNGTPNAGVTILDKSYKFNGSSGNISTGSKVFNWSDSSWTYNVWIKSRLITDNTMSGQKIVFISDAWLMPYIYLSLRNSLYNFRWHSSSPLVERTNTASQIPDVPVMVSCVWSRSEAKMKLYVNGELKNTSSVIPYANVNKNLRFGNTAQTGNFFDGELYTMQIFNRELSAAELLQIHALGENAYSPITNNLVSQYSGQIFRGTKAQPTKMYDVKILIDN